MDAMKKVILLYILCFPSFAYAEDIIKSLRSIIHIQNIMYISSGRIDNHSKNIKKIESLWASNKEILFTDKYERDWKRIELKDIYFNEGAKATSYLVFHKNNLSPVEVKGASLYQSGCAGEIIPLLNIGKWPFNYKVNYWEGIAIEIDKKHGIPKIMPVKNNYLHFLTKNEKDLIRTRYEPAIELKWNNALQYLQIILVQYEHSNGSYPYELIVINKDTKKIKILKAKTPLDYRC